MCSYITALITGILYFSYSILQHQKDTYGIDGISLYLLLTNVINSEKVSISGTICLMTPG